jgi:predicted peroxiredoxin
MSAKRFVIMIVGLIAAACVIGPAVAPAHAEDRPDTTLFLNLTTDDTWTASMALAYAGKVREAGYPVVVFLNVRGVRVADKNFPPDQRGLGDKTPKELLEDLIAKGVTVYVCPMCSDNAGMTQADWIDGTKPGGAETIKAQMAPATKVMSY